MWEGRIELSPFQTMDVYATQLDGLSREGNSGYTNYKY